VSDARRILHISDIHFGPKHLPRVSEGIAALVESERPDLVVISGDLTQRAKVAQFREARAFVERLEWTAPTISVPGNHDVPLWRVWERLFAPWAAWRRGFGRELEPVFRDESLLVVGMNSAQAWAFKGGRLRGRRLREVESELAAATPGQYRIVVVHHHIARPEGVDCEHPAWGASGVAARLASRVDLVLSGHLHRTLELYPAGNDGFPVLHTGTSSSSRGRAPEAGRNTAHWIEVGAGEAVVHGLDWNAGSGRFDRTFERRLPRRSQPVAER
jgi:3',5'-cyclic AMP phosphodiesterase CpdA